MEGVAPPGMERVVKKLKRYKGVDNPWALAWWIHRQKGSSELSDEDVEAALMEYLKFCGLDASAVRGGSSPMTPAESIEAYVQLLTEGGIKASQAALDYVEAPGGTRCATCRYAVHTGADGKEHEGECAIMYGTIDLVNGCCAAWKADLNQLSVETL